MNIILVVFDTMRQDCVGVYGAPPWGKVQTPHLDAFAQEAIRFTRAYPESLPTLPARRSLYTGQRVYPFADGNVQLKGDFGGVPGWGPIPEGQDTVAELLQRSGYRTALISDLYHQFKPSKNFHRGFDQWLFLRGQETDPYRSGPDPSQAEIDYWLPPEVQGMTTRGARFIRQCLKNMQGRTREEDYFNARVMIEASRWLEENQDAERFFLVVESFDPHEPWFVPPHYRRLYDPTDGREMVAPPYRPADLLPADLLTRLRANYSGLVTMCDRWFGHLLETIRTLGLLNNTAIIVMSDHGHALGDTNFVGKRGYPSHPCCLNTVLLVRHPHGTGAGMCSDLLLQHTDVAAQILDFASVAPSQAIHGQPFFAAAVAEQPALRDHVVLGWRDALTVIDDHWWMNCKWDGSGAFLYSLSQPDPFGLNVADREPETVRALFQRALADAGGEFPAYLLALAAGAEHTPNARVNASDRRVL